MGDGPFSLHYSDDNKKNTFNDRGSNGHRLKNVTGKQGLSLSFIDFWVNKSPGKGTHPGTFTALSATYLTWVHFTDKSHITNRDQNINLKILSLYSLLP